MCIVLCCHTVLTIIQNLLNVSDTQTRKRNEREAQFQDDKELLEEECAQIKAILSKDPNKYVSMCHRLFVIDLVHRFPIYVHDIETPLDELQDAVINASPRAPAVSAHQPKSALVLTYPTQWLMVLTIQTSMLIEGVVEMVTEVTTDIEIRNHLKSKPVWGASLAYAPRFQTFLDLFRA